MHCDYLCSGYAWAFDCEIKSQSIVIGMLITDSFAEQPSQIDLYTNDGVKYPVKLPKDLTEKTNIELERI